MELYIVGFCIIIAIAYFFFYNQIVSLRQSCQEAWSDIDVQLRRRHDLIPNLIETVKGYASHEKQVFEDITALRSQAMSTQLGDIASVAKVEQSIGAGIQQILGIAEAYPDLKANQEYLNLQFELTKTEDELASARRIYNGNVAAYNVKIATVPASIIASLQGFTPMSFFQDDDKS